MTAADSQFLLVCRAGVTLCALRVEDVIETMRLPPVESLPGAPEYVAGLAMVRGALLPVVIAERLLGASSGSPRRLVVVRTGTRRVGLAFDEVTGFHSMPRHKLDGLPPLLGEALIPAAEIGALDGELLLVLQAARLVSSEVFAALDAEAVL